MDFNRWLRSILKGAKANHQVGQSINGSEEIKILLGKRMLIKLEMTIIV